jgi:hypothetical protein
MVSVQERGLKHTQFLFAPSADHFLPRELCGNPQYNFLLKEAMGISEEAYSIVQQEGLSELMAPFIQININGGMIGELAEKAGWGNPKAHLIGTQRFVKATAEIIRLPYADSMRTQAAALIHDCDTRFNKEHLPLVEVIHNGNTTLKVDERALFGMELDDSGPKGVHGLESIDAEILTIAGVTHAKWVNPELWTPQQKMMRLADSSIGSTRDQSGAYVHDMFFHPEDRVQILKECKPVFNQLGIEVYGEPTFDRLSTINQMMETDLRHLGEQNNPALLWCYFVDNTQTNRFVDLVGDVMAGNVIPPKTSM